VPPSASSKRPSRWVAPVKASLLVTKQFRCNQGWWNGRTIYADDLELLGFGQPIQRKRPFHLGKGPATDYRWKRSPGARERERPGQRQGHFI
jgi:hypothetical protein